MNFTLSKNDYRNLGIDLGASEATQYDQRAFAIEEQLAEADHLVDLFGLRGASPETLEAIALAIKRATALTQEQEPGLRETEEHLAVWGHPDYVTDGTAYAAALDARCAEYLGGVTTFGELGYILCRPELDNCEEDPDAVGAFIQDLLIKRSINRTTGEVTR